MIGLLLRRLAILPLILLAVAAMTFTTASLSPFDPVDAYLGAEERANLTPEAKEEIARAWGLDASPPEQFVRWLGNLAQGNFGKSHMLAGRPVLDAIVERLGPTLILIGSSMLLILVLGLVMGVLAAAFRDTWVDWLIRNLSYLNTFAPSYWLALLAVFVFAVSLGWFPAAGISDFRSTSSGPTIDFRHLFLPMVTLAVTQHAWFTLFVRNTMLEVLREDYVRYARAHGLSEVRVLFYHALPNALIPFVTLAGAHMSELVGGSVLIETIFAWPGLGILAQRAARAIDLPLLVAIFLAGSVLVVVGNLVSDILYRLLDPRTRESLT